MKTLLTVVALLALTLAAPAADTVTDAKPITVPFELFKTKHMAVMVKINGKGPYRVIFDTGAPVTLLSSKLARATGLLKNAPAPLFNPFGAGGEVMIKTLEVGDVKADNVPAIVMDHPAVQAMASAFGPVEGIVGFSFFARYKMTLDYKAQKMTFTPNGFKPPDVMKDLARMLTNKLLQDPNAPPEVVAPAGQWGFVVVEDGGDKEPGVRVKEVRPGTPAAAAGLEVGDRLVAMDGRWTDTVLECYRAASQVKPGREAKLSVRRDGKAMEVIVKPAAGL